MVRLYRRKPAAKRAVKKRRTYKSRIPKIITSPPMHQWIKLRYVDNYLLAPSVNYVTRIWRVNDLYDPDYTGGGHQSLYRDQYFTIYKWGRVTAAKLTLEITPLNGGIYNCCLCPIYNVAGYAPVADTLIGTAIERPYARNETVSSYNNGRKMSLYMTSDKYFGQPRGETMTESNFEQNMGGSIGQDFSMWFQLLGFDVSGGGYSVYVKAIIEQWVRFENPISVAAS